MMDLNRNLKLVTAAVCTAAAAISISAQAAELTYEMSAYTDRPGGAQVLAGEYDAAIAAASSSMRSRDHTQSLVASTNLCVAYTMTGAFSEADAACERALTLASRADERPYTRFRSKTDTAKALSNRGVLRALIGDTMDAANDFRRAASLDPGWSAPDRNLAHLETSPAYRLAMAATSD